MIGLSPYIQEAVARRSTGKYIGIDTISEKSTMPEFTAALMEAGAKKLKAPSYRNRISEEECMIELFKWCESKNEKVPVYFSIGTRIFVASGSGVGYSLHFGREIEYIYRYEYDERYYTVSYTAVAVSRTGINELLGAVKEMLGNQT